MNTTKKGRGTNPAHTPCCSGSAFIELVITQAAEYSGERRDQVRGRLIAHMLGAGTDNPFDFSKKSEGVH